MSGRLAVVLGDQLDPESPALEGLDAGRDTVLMMEVREESTHVPSHRQRTVLFLSAMRHFARDLESRGLRVRYVGLGDPGNTHTIDGEVRRAAASLGPREIVLVRPGEHRLCAAAESWRGLGAAVRLLDDASFLTTPEQFAARSSRGGRMEHFYRRQRAALNILMDGAGGPVGGEWNFDKENRASFGRRGPSPAPPRPPTFEPDEITRAVMGDVERLLPGLPGRMERFGWPVTRGQSLECLAHFVEHRLAGFGRHEDAMWAGEPFLYHSALSIPLGLKLLKPGECVDAALRAYEQGKAPLQSVEGFVRQIIGWREFVRGVYWREGPGYAERNHLGQRGALPAFYWSGDTDMACLRACLGEVMESAYGHHIQRLMVVGNFALIAGVHPRAISDWFLGMYADAVEWVTLPNTLGMSQHADGGVMGSKPYAAGGAYIKRMSNYCDGCRYRPDRRSGEGACPFSNFYWDFIIRHEKTFERNPRMALPVRQARAMAKEERVRITATAAERRRSFGIGEITSGGAGRPS